VPVAQPRPPAPVEQKVSAPAPIVETLVEEKKPEEVIIPEEKPAKEKSKFPVFRSPYNFP
jgi:hypothetical protein